MKPLECRSCFFFFATSCNIEKVHGMLLNLLGAESLCRVHFLCGFYLYYWEGPGAWVASLFGSYFPKAGWPSNVSYTKVPYESICCKGETAYEVPVGHRWAIIIFYPAFAHRVQICWRISFEKVTEISLCIRRSRGEIIHTSWQIGSLRVTICM